MKNDTLQRRKAARKSCDFCARLVVLQAGRCAWKRMKALILFVGLCILFVLCWPLAILALILLPVVWLLSLLLRLIGITFEAVFGLIRGLLLLPVRLLNLVRRDKPQSSH